MKFRLYIAFLISLSLYTYADSWAPAEPLGSISPDGDIIVRITPGDSLGDTWGFAGAKTGEYATATYYKFRKNGGYSKFQEIKLRNPIAPLFAAVSNDGTLVTLDNWHNMGIGNALTLYKPDGSHQQSFPLEHFYSKEQISKFDSSVSSLWWRCGIPQLHPRTSELHIDDQLGGTLAVNIHDGSYRYESDAGRCAQP